MVNGKVYIEPGTEKGREGPCLVPSRSQGRTARREGGAGKDFHFPPSRHPSLALAVRSKVPRTSRFALHARTSRFIQETL